MSDQPARRLITHTTALGRIRFRLSGVPLTTVYLCAAMGSVGVLFLPQGALEAASNPLYVGTWILLYLASGFSLLLRPYFDRETLILLALSIFAIVSAVWSPQPLATVTNATMLLANVLFIAQSRRVVSAERFVRVVLWSTTFLAFAGTVMAIVGLDSAMYIDAHQRSTYLGTQPIRGLFSHKITAGVFATIAAVIAAVCLNGAKRVLLPVALFAFVLATGSTGALALFTVSIVITFLVTLSLKLRLKSEALVTGLVTAMVLGAVFVGTALPFALEAVGGDASLTGRSELWGWAWDVILQRPILGFGYYGYIGSEMAKQAALEIPRFVYYDVPHFHNAYLQTLVDLGVVGFAVQVFLLLYALAKHYRRAYYTHDRTHLAFAVVLIVIVAVSMGMHALFQYNHFLTLFAFRAFVSEREP